MPRPKKPAAKKATVPATFTLSRELLAQIEALAQQENRPRSRMIEIACREYIQNHRRRSVGDGMTAIDRMRGELIKVRILRNIARRHRQSDIPDMAEAEPGRPLLDVPLHKRGFGVMDEDAA